jgi:hypothetical protein
MALATTLTGNADNIITIAAAGAFSSLVQLLGYNSSADVQKLRRTLA